MTDDFLSGLLGGLEKEAGTSTAPTQSTLIDFAENEVVTDRGPFKLKGRAPFRTILELIERVTVNKEAGTRISILAAEQVGKTVAMLAAALRLVIDVALNVVLFLPTNTFAHTFGRTRLKNLINSSTYLKTRLKESDAVDQATVKEANGHFFMLLGLDSILSAISWPFDWIFNDEVDHLPAENQEWSEGRVAASEYRVIVDTSAGYVPGAGIDLLYQDGTQHRWFVPCRDCGKEWCLEEHFPRCMKLFGANDWRRVCPDCQTEIDPDGGRMVARFPERAKERRYSFRISSLAIAARDANHIMNEWRKAQKSRSKRAKFDCKELARPNAGAMQPITEAEIARMRQDYVMTLSQSGRPRFAGLDGGDLCHFISFERDERSQARLVWAEIIDSDNAEEIVAQRIVQLGIVSFVADKKPLTNLSRSIAYRFPAIAKLQDFKNGSVLVVKEQTHKKHVYKCVNVDRNESLEETTSAMTDELLPFIIPNREKLRDAQAEVMRAVEEQFMNLRKLRTADAYGRPIDRYVDGVANHFGMAINSAFIAEETAPPHIRISVPKFPKATRHAQLTSALRDGDDEDRSRFSPFRRTRGRQLRRAV